MRHKRRLDAGTHGFTQLDSSLVLFVQTSLKLVMYSIKAMQKENESREAELKRLQLAIEIYDEKTLDQIVDEGQGCCQISERTISRA